jgi:hypothetical protein
MEEAERGLRRKSRWSGGAKCALEVVVRQRRDVGKYFFLLTDKFTSVVGGIHFSIWRLPQWRRYCWLTFRGSLVINISVKY